MATTAMPVTVPQFGDPRTVELTVADPRVTCCFCGSSEVNPAEWGVLMKLDDIVAHHFCLMFSAGLEQEGQDNEGIYAFLPRSIKAEVRRGKRLKCKLCKKKGATIGCGLAQCRQSYHYRCGYANGALFQFYGNFTSFCVKHKTRQEIPPDTSLECPICISSLDESDMDQAVWPPCCGKQVFHRRCIMATAKAAGYFFKCPLCNSKEPVFIQAMKANGVYVPEQDAEWETEPNAYQELMTYYSHCDAERCLCPQGREYYDKAQSETWNLVRCHYCAHSATHVECTTFRGSKWKCTACTNLFHNKPDLIESDEESGAEEEDSSSESSDEESGDETPPTTSPQYSNGGELDRRGAQPTTVQVRNIPRKRSFHGSVTDFTSVDLRPPGIDPPPIVSCGFPLDHADKESLGQRSWTMANPNIVTPEFPSVTIASLTSDLGLPATSSLTVTRLAAPSFPVVGPGMTVTRIRDQRSPSPSLLDPRYSPEPPSKFTASGPRSPWTSSITSEARSPWEPTTVATEARSPWEPTIATEARSPWETTVSTEARSPWEPTVATEARTPWEPTVATEARTPWEPTVATEARSPWEPTVATEARSPWEPTVATEARSPWEQTVSAEPTQRSPWYPVMSTALEPPWTTSVSTVSSSLVPTVPRSPYTSPISASPPSPPCTSSISAPPQLSWTYSADPRTPPTAVTRMLNPWSPPGTVTKLVDPRTPPRSPGTVTKLVDSRTPPGTVTKVLDPFPRSPVIGRSSVLSGINGPDHADRHRPRSLVNGHTKVKSLQLADLVNVDDSGDEVSELPVDIAIEKVVPGFRKDSTRSLAFRNLLQSGGRSSHGAGAVSTALRGVKVQARRRSRKAGSAAEVICLDLEDVEEENPKDVQTGNAENFENGKRGRWRL